MGCGIGSGYYEKIGCGLGAVTATQVTPFTCLAAAFANRENISLDQALTSMRGGTLPGVTQQTTIDWWTQVVKFANLAGISVDTLIDSVAQGGAEYVRQLSAAKGIPQESGQQIASFLGDTVPVVLAQVQCSSADVTARMRAAVSPNAPTAPGGKLTMDEAMNIARGLEQTRSAIDETPAPYFEAIYGAQAARVAPPPGSTPVGASKSVGTAVAVAAGLAALLLLAR